MLLPFIILQDDIEKTQKVDLMQKQFVEPKIRLFNKYNLLSLVGLSLNFIVTKLVCPQAKIIKYPFYLRGKKYMVIGNNFSSGVGLRMDAFPSNGRNCIRIGENVQFNDYVHIAAVNSIEIGKNVLIASKVFITDHNHGFYGAGDVHTDPTVVPINRELSVLPVVIDDDVWIGEFVSILPGVRIGKGSIIGTMSVVSKDIPPYSIAVGSPAKVIKKYNFDSKKWEKTA